VEQDPRIPADSGVPQGANAAGVSRWREPTAPGPLPVGLLPVGEPEPVQLGPYRLLGLLGVGGMARVYLAVRADAPDRQIALKVLDRALCAQAGHRRAFRDEARLSARLEHPNIVRTLTSGEDGDRMHLAMERVPGWTLARLLDELSVVDELPPEPVVVGIALQVARALAYAHRLRDDDGRALRVVHRDLKPGNLMIDRTGRVRVLDFGIARWADRQTTTGRGFVKGTVAYMSPEQVLGLRLTGRSDIFALGSVMVALALGRAPFQRAHLRDAGEALLNADLGPLRHRLTAALPRLHPLVERCLDVSPAERPSAIAVVAHLEALAREVPSGLDRWMERIEPLLWPLPEASDWGPEGPPAGLRSTRAADGVIPP
jgi:serine/threonine protein kinase